MSAALSLINLDGPTQELPAADRPRSPHGWERAQVEARLAREYQVVRELGRGAMGVVFLARDLALHRLVALKVLRQEFAASAEHRERFRREARTSARLTHPGVVPVYAFGEKGDLAFIAMKYVHGESLADRMRREGKLPAAEAQRILVELAQALESAHHERVVHRDLKAENIILEHGTGRVMLTDFGVALLRSLDPVRKDAARAFGTPHYMSPEQATGELDVDHRSDVYSLGVLGYYMLSGRLPFDGASFAALAAKHVAEAHEPVLSVAPETPAPLAAAVERCLRKDREERWSSAAAFASALVPAKAESRWRRSRIGARRGAVRGWMVAELGLIVAAARAVIGRGTA